MTNRSPADPGTLKVTFNVPTSLHDVLVAELADLTFSAFQEVDGRLVAYCPANTVGPEGMGKIRRWLIGNGLSDSFAEEVIPPRNWNEEWERSITPVYAGRFVVLPTRYADEPIPDGTIPIWIDPKMSFGTGHHETTQLVLRCLPDVCTPGDRVLDIGTGTGVLAIAAAKLGAAAAFACDTDPWASENAAENIHLNGVAHLVHYFPGSLGDVPASTYDVILANIQANVLTSMLPEIREVTRPDGRVILSGLLQTDAAAMEARARDQGIIVDRIEQAGEWIAMCLRMGA